MERKSVNYDNYSGRRTHETWASKPQCQWPQSTTAQAISTNESHRPSKTIAKAGASRFHLCKASQPAGSSLRSAAGYCTSQSQNLNLMAPIRVAQIVSFLVSFTLALTNGQAAGQQTYLKNLQPSNAYNLYPTKQLAPAQFEPSRRRRYLASPESPVAVEPPRGRYPEPPPQLLPSLPPLPPLQTATNTIQVPGAVPNMPDMRIQVVMPYEGYKLLPNSTGNLIENRRFVESVSSRCWSSTIMENPMSVEPSFIIIRPRSEVRLNATVPTELIRSVGNFDPKKKTIILVHGFTQSYPSTDWLRRSRALFEKHAKVAHQNLIIMDWGRASQGSYMQVAGMVSGMGSFLANFLMKLLELGAERQSIHIIGHSLGAHLAGFAGKRLRPRIGRITALDAAGPCFGKFFSNSPLDRLSPDDAYEVDAYHYDDSFLGLPGQHGQFDVYVNGGSSQPGCEDNYNSMLNAVITMIFRRNRVLSESHTRSTEVCVSELALTGCQQVAYECRDYPAFLQGECGRCDELNGQCFLMGFDFQYTDIPGEMPLRSSYPGKRLYINTGGKELFCLQHYQILVKFEPTPEMAQQAKSKKWRLQLELNNDLQRTPMSSSERITNITMTNQMAPNVFSYLLLLDKPPSRFIGAHLQVRQSDGSLVQLAPPTRYQQQQLSPSKGATFWPFVLEVNFMSNINPEVRRTLSSRLCPVYGAGYKELYPNDQSAWLHFEECLGGASGRY